MESYHAVRKPDPMDSYIGNRLRLRRMQIGMSQEKLGHLVGLTFQQIQKYEKGQNRIGGSRVFQLAAALRVEPGYFFERVAPVKGAEKEEEVDITEALGSHEFRLLYMAFAKIGNPTMRKQLVRMAKAMSIEDEVREAA